jgi:hypothetical protein
LLLPANRLIDPASFHDGSAASEKTAGAALSTVTGFATWLAIATLKKSDVVLVAPLLQRASLRMHDFADRQGRISEMAQATFLEDATRAMHESAFALHLAVKAYPREGGLLFDVASAATAGRIRRLRWHPAQNKNESWACHPWRKRGASCGERNDGAASVDSKRMKSERKWHVSFSYSFVISREPGVGAAPRAQK